MATDAELYHKLESSRSSLAHLNESIGEFLSIKEDADWPGLLAKFNALISRHHFLIREISPLVNLLNKNRKRKSFRSFEDESSDESDQESSGGDSNENYSASKVNSSAFRSLVVCPQSVYEADPELTPRVLLRTKLIPEIEQIQQTYWNDGRERLGVDPTGNLDETTRKTNSALAHHDAFVFKCKDYFVKQKHKLAGIHGPTSSSMALVGLSNYVSQTAENPQLASLIIHMIDSLDLSKAALEKFLHWASDGPEYRLRISRKRDQV